MYVRVLPEVSGVDGEFDYVVPERLRAGCAVGVEVVVLFRKRRVNGWVTAVGVDPPAGVEPLEVVRLRSAGPPAGMVDLARWAAWRWAGRRARFMRLASPPRVVPLRALVPDRAQAESEGSDTSTDANAQSREGSGTSGRRIVVPGEHLDGVSERCGSRGGGGLSGAAAGTGERWWAPALAAGTHVVRMPPAMDALGIVVEAAGIYLTTGMSGDAENRTGGGGDGEAAGVTGGAGGRSVATGPHGSRVVLVLVPTHAEAERTTAWLAGWNLPVALLPRDWAAVRGGGCVAVGTRSAAFAPADKLAAVLVLQADDDLYREESGPAWSGWRVAAERASRDGVPCLLVSSVPTQEMLQGARLLTPPAGVERAGWPAAVVVDTRDADPYGGLVSDDLLHAMRWVLREKGRRGLCVLNRRPKGSLLACRGCGDLLRCSDCVRGVWLPQVEAGGGVGADYGGGGSTVGGGMAVAPATEAGAARSAGGGAVVVHCGYCGSARVARCDRCATSAFRQVGAGLDRLRRELERALGVGVPVVSGGGRGGAREGGNAGACEAGQAGGWAAAQEGGRAGAQVVAGTEALLYRYERADVVAFADIDVDMLSARLDAPERTASRIARAAMLLRGSAAQPPSGHRDRDGSGRASGRLVIQTRDPDNAVLRSVLEGDPGVLAGVEKEMRLRTGLPPFSAVASISGSGAGTYAARISKSAALVESVELSGPLDGKWSLRAPDHRVLCDLLASVSRPRGERLRVEVDPPAI